MIMKFTGTVLKNLFSKPATSGYPFTPAEYPERTRGHIEIDMDACVLCGLCSKNCPPRTIKVDRAAGTWSINRFDCIQCGFCTTICAKKALKIVPGYQEPGDTKLTETFKKESKEPAKHPVSNSEVCVYCTLCAKKCPQGAITVDRAAKTWALDESKCVSCGVCADTCPKKCIEMK